MYRTPLKNSKNVSKPFKSPFDSPAQNKDQSKSCDRKGKVNDRIVNSPLAARNLDAKRVLVLDEEEKEKEKFKNLDHPSEDENVSCTPKTVEKINRLSILDKNALRIPKKLTKSDLLVLKKKTFEVRQELESIKSREMCTKKNDPEKLRVSIKQWRTACQNALEILCSETSERNGQNLKISDILSMLNIPEELVNYSAKDDSFN